MPQSNTSQCYSPAMPIDQCSLDALEGDAKSTELSIEARNWLFLWGRFHFSFSYSTLASRSTGRSVSAFFHNAKKSSKLLQAFALSPVSA